MNNTTKRKQVNAPIKISKVDTKTNTIIATYSSIREAEKANYYGQTTLHHRFKKGKFDEDGFKWVLVES